MSALFWGSVLPSLLLFMSSRNFLIHISLLYLHFPFSLHLSTFLLLLQCPVQLNSYSFIPIYGIINPILCVYFLYVSSLSLCRSPCLRTLPYNTFFLLYINLRTYSCEQRVQIHFILYLLLCGSFLHSQYPSPNFLSFFFTLSILVHSPTLLFSLLHNQSSLSSFPDSPLSRVPWLIFLPNQRISLSPLLVFPPPPSIHSSILLSPSLTPPLLSFSWNLP